MSDLLNSQRALQNYLLNPDVPDFRDSMTALISESGNVSRPVRLHIYSNAYRSRLVDALSADFNALHAYLGDDAFTELVYIYVDRHPSHYFSLRNVGGNFSEFLKNNSPYAGHIELHELAIFEWALCHAFDAADVNCVDAMYFTTLPAQCWAELRLNFVPSLQMFSLRSNAPDIWKSLNAGQTPPALEIAAQSQQWIVWRRDLKMLFRPIDDIEGIAFGIFMRGETFADVCEVLAEAMPENDVPRRCVNLLQQWLGDGLIATS